MQINLFQVKYEICFCFCLHVLNAGEIVTATMLLVRTASLFAIVSDLMDTSTIGFRSCLWGACPSSEILKSWAANCGIQFTHGEAGSWGFPLNYMVLWQG